MLGKHSATPAMAEAPLLLLSESGFLFFLNHSWSQNQAHSEKQLQLNIPSLLSCDLGQVTQTSHASVSSFVNNDNNTYLKSLFLASNM
jgi:hypothetical protein